MHHLACEFPGCGISIRLDLPDGDIADRIATEALGEVYGNRLPRLRVVADSPLPSSAAVSVEMSSDDGVNLVPSGAIALKPYATDIAHVRWDLWKVLGVVLCRALLREGIVTLHAAAVQTGDRTWLLPGESGSGKSSLAFLARRRGARVLASELCFVRDGALVAGNSALCIERDALTTQRIPLRGDEGSRGAFVFAPADETPLDVRPEIAFPLIGDALRHQALSHAATQERLRANALGQLEHGRHFGGREAAAADIGAVTGEVSKLAEAGSMAVEGSVHEIWTWLAG